MSANRLRIGKLVVDSVTFEEALAATIAMWKSGRGGSVFTPNVDHTVLVDDNERFARAYERVGLSIADGMPILWAARLLGYPLPEKVSGSDLVVPLVERAAENGMRVYFLGAAEGIAARAAAILVERFPKLIVAGIESPRINLNEDRSARADILERLKAAKPDLVLVALGAPKQELWIDEVVDELRPAVFVGIGASLDFVAGSVRRAPPWMSNNGLEWAFRLGQEPKRLWRRYLLQDPKFAAIVLRTLRLPRSERLVRQDAE
ncbi:MAG: glycosyl transferase, WecB/TagA/CpsF family [Myxococcaceae bacterium]|nr:glycosyl transferase, WecB/TagA/CpsF family [Myxococcaceae bacterium]